MGITRPYKKAETEPGILLKRIVSLVSVVLIGAPLLIAAGPAAAERKIHLIRDAEIENIIRTYSAPVLSVAGLDPAAVKIHLINDKSLNAFVAGGQNIFLHTGLLVRSEHAGQVIGVVAHETGHIVGGHLTRFDDAFRTAQIQSIVSFILGAAAAIAAGDGRAGAAVIGAGQSVALRSLLKYSRTQEAAADQFAISALDRTGISARGMLEFFRIMEGQEFLVVSRQDPYVRTHPMTGSRIEFVRNHVEGSPYSDATLSPRFDVMHKRMLAKLSGFLEPLHVVLRKYKESDNSVYSRYARAVAYHRQAKTDKAVRTVNSLIAEQPNDPYFQELKGQILFESGQVRAALAPYENSVRLLPNEPLLRTALAAAQIESQDQTLLQPALANLKQSSRLDPEVPYTWRLLATAYGRLDNTDLAALALAEEAIRLNRPGRALQAAKRAMSKLPKGSPGWVRAQDIAQLAEKQKEEHE